MNDLNNNNNNIYITNYLSFLSSPLPSHLKMESGAKFISSIRKSVDFITFSIDDAEVKDGLIKILEAGGFSSRRNDKISKGNYNFKWRFHHPADNVTVDIFYGLRKPSPVIPPIRIKIHDPNRETVDYLTKAFICKKIKTTLSEIELTFDFFSEDTKKVWDLIVSSLFQFHQRKSSSIYLDDVCGNTFYTTNIRKTRHFGMRVYEKTFPDKMKAARMELVLKADRIRDMDLALPLDNLDEIPLRNFFEFKIFDVAELLEYIKRIGLEEIPNPHYEASAKPMLWVHDYLMNSESLMQIYEKLKAHSAVFINYIRFIPCFEEFQEIFESKISGQKFLATREERRAFNKGLKSSSTPQQPSKKNT